MLLQLAMATLGVTFTGAALSMGGKKAEDPTTPPINAKSPDEENFVKCVHTTYPQTYAHPCSRCGTSSCDGAGRLLLESIIDVRTRANTYNREYVKKAADKVQGKQ